MKYEGEPVETEETEAPQLFSLDDAPFKTAMNPGDESLLHSFMNGKEVLGKIYMAEKNGERYVSMYTTAINTLKK